MRRAVLFAAAMVAMVAVTWLYTHRLDDAPAYLNLDEAHFGVHAKSLASTGRDLNGNLVPVFISLEDPLGDRPALAWGTTWYHPIGFYLIASVLTVAPLAEWSIRLPIAIVGVLNIALIYLVARRWFNDRLIGIAAAALLGMTPAHFILSRMALDYLLPVPFTLGWLWALGELMERADRRRAIMTGVILGLGCYSYISSWLIMPLYLSISVLVTLWTLGRRDLIAPLLGGFVAALIPVIAWVAFHPAMPGNVMAQYQVGGTSNTLRGAVGAYWSYFNPSFLFVNGGSSRLVSTGLIGVWTTGMAIMLIASARSLVRGISPRTAILIAGVLIAPLPAALKGEPFAIQRAVGLLPFGALLAASGLAVLRDRSLIERGVVVIALLSVPWQFSTFIGDYFSGYRMRSASVVDSTAFREATAVLVDAAGTAPAIALTAPLNDVSAKWRFYAEKHHHPEWLARTRYFSGDLAELAGMPAGSIAVVESAQAAAHDGWIIMASPSSVGGDSPLTILRRQ